MLIMGLDTALQRCSVAVVKDGETLAAEAIGLERGHAEHIAPMADKALRRAGVSVADLDRIGVVVGPGGFTGVRVALAFARGLAVGTGLPVVGVTSLAALAGAVKATDETALIAPVIDAKRGQVYAALYRQRDDALLAPFVASPENAFQRLKNKAGEERVLLAGTGAELLPASRAWARANAPSQIDATIVAHLAARAPTPSGPPAPLYLRPPDAKPPKPNPLERLRAP